MRTLIGALAVALLAGCTTPSDLMSMSPVMSATSKQDPKTYALCVYPSWQDYRSSAVMSETASGYRIVAGNDMNGQTDDVLNIVRIAGGSSINLYQRMSWQQLGRSSLRESFRSCL